MQNPTNLTSVSNSGGKLRRSRRSFVETSLTGLAAVVVGASVEQSGEARERPKMIASEAKLIRTDADIDRLLPKITNWGRWGKSDQLGTLNYITPQLRYRAAILVKTGDTVY